MVLAEDYRPEFGRRILGGFKESGWNLYLLARAGHIGREEIIRAGPAEQLEVGESYIVYPVAFDPKDAEQVFTLGALKKAKTGLCCPEVFIVEASTNRSIRNEGQVHSSISTDRRRNCLHPLN